MVIFEHHHCVYFLRPVGDACALFPPSVPLQDVRSPLSEGSETSSERASLKISSYADDEETSVLPSFFQKGRPPRQR